MSNKPKKKVLIITYYWPPSGGAGVQRWLKFAKYLPQFDVEPIILTVDEKFANYPQIDETLLPEVAEDMWVYRTKSKDLLKKATKIIGKKNVVYGGFSNVNKKNTLQTILRFMRGNFYIPDLRKGWNKYAKIKATEVISTHEIDTIITTGPPHSTHLVGLYLKKKLNIRWIADFRDPWTDIYYYNDMLHTPLAKYIDKRLESNVLNKIDELIITIDKTLKKDIASKYPNLPISVISNGYDESDFENKKRILPDKFTICYTGTLPESYDIDVFIDACEQLHKENFDFVIKFIGNVSKSKLEKMYQVGLEDKIQIIDYVVHSESIDNLLSSSMLLLAFPYVNNTYIVPGKFFEYFASNIPILCVGSREGDVQEYFKSDPERHIVVEKGEVQKTVDFIKKIYQQYENEKSKTNQDSLPFEINKHAHIFERQELTKKLSSVINK